MTPIHKLFSSKNLPLQGGSVRTCQCDSVSGFLQPRQLLFKQNMSRGNCPPSSSAIKILHLYKGHKFCLFDCLLWHTELKLTFKYRVCPSKAARRHTNLKVKWFIKGYGLSQLLFCVFWSEMERKRGPKSTKRSPQLLKLRFK